MSNSPTETRRATPSWRRAIAQRVGVLLGLSLLPLLLGWAAWWIELGRVLTPHAFALASCGTVLYAVAQMWRLAGALAIVAAVHGSLLYPAWTSQVPAPSPDSMTIVVANVLTSNRDYGQLTALAKDLKPDMIGLMEVDEGWLRALDRPLRDYPNRLLIPREDNFGLALYARDPDIGLSTADLGVVPTLVATLPSSRGGLSIFLAHVTPPYTGDYVEHRDAQLLHTADAIRAAGRPAALLGDLNSTPYNAIFGRVLGRGGLLHGGPLEGTWPAGWPGLLRFPIDHVLVTPGVGASVEVQRAIGSDHLPLLVKLSS